MSKYLSYALIGIPLLLAMVFCVGAVGVGADFVDARTTGPRLEQELNKIYLSCQNNLSQYKLAFYEQLNIAQYKSDALDRAIESALMGNFDSGQGTQGTGGQAPVIDRAELILYFQRNFPDLSGLDIWDELIDFIQSGRAGFKNCQDQLIDAVGSYDLWRTQGVLHPFVVQLAGFPSQNLRAAIGSDVVYGLEALERMRRIVLSRDALDAYETGIDTPAGLPTRVPSER